ncbi:MAG: small multi-drug export protein [bacterium]|nr:small multi-drug export protein [bacterium]
MHSLVEWIQALPPNIAVFLLATLPIIELRGAIPFGVSVYEMSYPHAYLVSVLGNLTPIVPILLALGPVERWLGRWPLFRRFFDWVFARSRRKGKLIERFKFFGLILFVGIPLPVTGAWTGAAAAYVFGVPLKRSLPAIIIGVLLAGIIVSLAWAGGVTIFTKLPVSG